MEGGDIVVCKGIYGCIYVYIYIYIYIYNRGRKLVCVREYRGVYVYIYIYSNTRGRRLCIGKEMWGGVYGGMGVGICVCIYIYIGLGVNESRRGGSHPSITPCHGSFNLLLLYSLF